MTDYQTNARVVTVLPNAVRDRLFEAASDRGYSTSHLLREMVIRELDKIDAAKMPEAA